jgi:murein DD-endopeptidase MepM/ murein hydrolase activator NlpD
VSKAPRNILRMASILSLAIVQLSTVACGVYGYGGDRPRKLGSSYYTVRQGDTLYGISRQFNVPQDQLVRVNGILNPDSLLPGQRLFISYGSAIASSNTPASSSSDLKYQPKTSGGRLAWPIRGGRLVSRFGPRRTSFHDGLDIAAPRGTPVYAAHSGKVVYAGSKLSGYGKLLLIRGNDGLITVYAHNRRMLVSNNEPVKVGQKIAEVGTTGRSSGPHLHFEVRTVDSRNRVVAIDPLPLLKGGAAETRPRYRVNESLNSILSFLQR